MKSKKYITQDGYVFTQSDDGTLTDGDITYKSLKHLQQGDNPPYTIIGVKELKEERTREEKLEVLNQYKTDLMTDQSKEITNLRNENNILLETNADLQNQIENIKSEIQILTGDLRASVDALDDLE